MQWFPRRLAVTCMLLLCSLLAACGTGQVRRVSDPSASIQQLTVRADGSWAIELRIQNFSSIPMRFDRLALALQVGGAAVGSLQLQPALSIGPEAADVTSINITPTPAARIVVADSLARGRGLTYTLEGTIEATPEDSSARTFQLKRDNGLSPVPGLPGVLR